MIHACASAMAATGADSGSISIRTAATTMNGTTCATVVSVQSRPRLRSVSALARLRPGTAASSGRLPASKLPAGDGLAENDGGLAVRQLAHVRRLAGAVA